ncbi:MAG TPA: NYN domain-containing protein [Ktedonobacterales bacterium]
MADRLILVDGYNAIRRTEGLRAAEARGGLEAGRQALLGWLANRYRATPHAIVVVFDGAEAEEREERRARWSRCRIVFTRAGTSADEAIARIAAEERVRGAEVMMFSDDDALRAAVAEAGATPQSIQALAGQVNAPDKYRRKQAIHRKYVRDHYGIGHERDR